MYMVMCVCSLRIASFLLLTLVVEIELIQQGSPDYLREMTSTAPLPHIYFSQAVIFKTTMVMGGHTLGLEASMHRKTQTLGSILFS